MLQAQAQPAWAYFSESEPLILFAKNKNACWWQHRRRFYFDSYLRPIDKG
jgi:hypothetical protein